MNMHRRHFSVAFVAAAGALLPLEAALAQAAAPVEGKDFIRLDPPQPSTSAPGKIEVLEFFSYACPHCSAFEPVIEAWEKQLPADVALRRVPVPFMMNAENFQRTYYALETIGAVQSMQLKIFRAIHIDRVRLEKGEDMAELVAKNGGDSAKFLAAFKSFSVATSVTRAKKMLADYKIESVPTIVVGGRYVTSPSMAGTPQASLAVVDTLLQRLRKA